MKGRTFAARYRIDEPLGTGGMSTVWQATDLRLDIPVAVKLLDPAIAEDEKSQARFMREAKTSAKLRNRHVVQSLDCGVDDGVPFIVMELLTGDTLRARLKERGRLAAAEVAQILVEVARGIEAAHAAGIVHRDLKPENVFLVQEGESEYAKILDFGIAKQQPTPGQTASLGLTEPGSLFGTPNYMSPEQIDARSPIDHRTDIWAMAIVAFECLTGRVPFGEATLREQLLAICARPLPVPSEVADVPEGFDAWFARAAAQDITERYATVKDAMAELCRICGVAPQSLAPATAPGTTTGASPAMAPIPAASASPGIPVRPLPMQRLGCLVLTGVVLTLAAILFHLAPQLFPVTAATSPSVSSLPDKLGSQATSAARPSAKTIDRRPGDHALPKDMNGSSDPQVGNGTSSLPSGADITDSATPPQSAMRNGTAGNPAALGTREPERRTRRAPKLISRAVRQQ